MISAGVSPNAISATVLPRTSLDVLIVIPFLVSSGLPLRSRQDANAARLCQRNSQVAGEHRDGE